MTTLLMALHVFVSLFLIVVVLLQGGKGAEMGSVFGGGSSQTLFGSRGGATFMNKLTTGIAVAFMITSLVLTVVSLKGGSVVKSTVIPEEKTLPVPPAGVTPESGGVKPVNPEQTPSNKPAGK